MSARMRPLQLWPADLGRLRAANLIYRRRFEGGNGKRRETKLRDGSRFDLMVGEWPQAQAFLTGEYDRPTVEFIAKHLPPNGVFIDGGAHIGLISFQVLQRVPDAVVHAFEPHPDRGEQYKRDAALNGAQDRVHFNPVGLSDDDGEVGFDLDRHRVTETNESIVVTRLDDYAQRHGIERIDVLKLDIEGHEIHALRGAERLLSEKRIAAVTLEAMEAHGDTAGPRELLEGYGYRRVPLEAGASMVRRLAGRPPSTPNEAYLAI
jgi:FkbM family methyltransferase